MVKKGLLFAIILTIITPLILSFTFLTFLTPIDWPKMIGGIPQYLAILSFASLAFAYNVPVFGYGYVISLLIWLITGLLVGLFCRSVKRSIIITLLGLCIQLVLFIALVSIDSSFISSQMSLGLPFSADSTISLLSGFTSEFFITLGLLLIWWGLVLPGSVLGGIMGGLVSRSSISE